MEQETIDFVRRNVAFLAARGHAPHIYLPTDPYQGCRLCHQGPGALQHNEYFVRDYHAALKAGLLDLSPDDEPPTEPPPLGGDFQITDTTVMILGEE